MIWTEHTGIQMSHFSNGILPRVIIFFFLVSVISISLRAIRSLHICIPSFFHYQEKFCTIKQLQ